MVYSQFQSQQTDLHQLQSISIGSFQYTRCIRRDRRCNRPGCGSKDLYCRGGGRSNWSSSWSLGRGGRSIVHDNSDCEKGNSFGLVCTMTDDPLWGTTFITGCRGRFALAFSISLFFFGYVNVMACETAIVRCEDCAFICFEATLVLVSEGACSTTMQR